MEDREPYITGGKMREMKFSFMWQHQETGRWLDKRYTLDEIIGGDPYDDMSDSPLLRNYHHKHTREYTGLKDKKGNPIYEGDIVYIAGVGNCKVEWDECHAGWIFDNRKQGEEYSSVIEDLETIVGNIYENPELLK